MAEEERSNGRYLSFLDRSWCHTEHIAALIVQRAFLRSRLRNATAERLRAEDIAKKLAQAETEVLRRNAFLRRGHHLKVQLSTRLGRFATTVLQSNGSSKTFALLTHIRRRTSSKRPSGAAAARHLAALQILRRLRMITGHHVKNEESETAETPAPPGPFPSPSPRSRFSRASAVHQLTPYRPRRSGSGSRTPPQLAAEAKDPNQTPPHGSCLTPRPSAAQKDCLGNQGGIPPGSPPANCADAESPDPTVPQSPHSPETGQERCPPGPVSAAQLSVVEALGRTAEQPVNPPQCPEVSENPSSIIALDKVSGLEVQPLAAGQPLVESTPSTPHGSDLPPPTTPLDEFKGRSRASPRLSSFPGGEAPAYATPLLKSGSESRLAFGLSPFPGGTPPLPSKLAAKAANEMGVWREEVQHMRAELSRSYKSICQLQSVMWESPSARRLLSPATLRQKRSPHRSLRRSKLPPSPLSRMSMSDDSSQSQSRPPSAAKQGLATGVFYLGVTDSGGFVRTVAKPTAGAVVFARNPDAAGAPAPGTLERERVQRRSWCESGSEPKVLDGGGKGVSNPRETSGQSADREGGGLSGGPSNSAAVRSNLGRSAHETDRHESTPGVASARDNAPSSSNRTSHDPGMRRIEVGRGTNAVAGVDTAPAGILGFLHGLFSPVPVVNAGLQPASPSRRSIGGDGAPSLGREAHGAAESTRGMNGVSTAEPDTWHDASDEVLPRSILIEHSPNGASPSSSPRHTNALEPFQTRASLFHSSPAGHPATTPVRSPALSIQAVALPPLTSSYSTTPAALSLPPPLVFSTPRAGHESSPRRSRVLVHRPHNETEKPILHTKSEVWSAPAPPTPFHPDSENVPGNTRSLEQSKGRTKRAAAARSVNERGLLSSFYQVAGPGSRPLPPVTREFLQQKANSGKEDGRTLRCEKANRGVDSAANNVGDSFLDEGRHVKWWDAEEEEDKENGVGGGKKPKARSPRFSPKHMSATPSKSILKQGVHVGSRSVAQARDARLRKLQAQAALGPKISGRALRIKGRYI